MGKIIGIDLGTTNSCVAIIEGGKPKVLVNEEGARTTPSVVAYTKESEKLVGQIAKRQAVTNPQNTIFSAKRFIGRKFGDIKDQLSMMPYKVVQKKGSGDCAFEIDGKQVTPEEIAAGVLSKIKKVAEDYIGQPVTEAVITVPAYFNDSQRQATKDAGKIAGFDVKRIINEPTAAALAYGLDKKNEQKIAVFDFGGGTFDISILTVGGEVVEVRSTNGDTQLGGDNFDEIILKWMIDEFKKDQGVDLSQDKMAMQRLKEAAEKAKIELSNMQETEINLPFVTADQSGPKHLNLKLSRAKFEQMTAELVERCLKPCAQALEDSGFSKGDIDEVILVGGTTRIPTVQEAVKNFFGKESNKTVNPDEVVALGAAIQGGVLGGDVQSVLLLDVTPLSLGIETLGGVMTRLIERNTTIPSKKTQIFSTAADNQPSVDVHVLQGEREMAPDNKTLGRFELTGITPAPRGVPQVEVSFDIDVNGILHVSAKDLSTGQEQNIEIVAKSGLNDQEIERMVKEAAENAEVDKTKRERITERNTLDTLIYQTEKLMKESSDDIEAAHKTKTEEAIRLAKEVMANAEAGADELKSSGESIIQASQEMSTAMYQKQKEKASSEADGGTSSEEASEGAAQEEDVIDADFKDVN